MKTYLTFALLLLASASYAAVSATTAAKPAPTKPAAAKTAAAPAQTAIEYSCADYNKIAAMLPNGKIFKDVEAEFAKQKKSPEFQKFAAANIFYVNTTLKSRKLNQKSPKNQEEFYKGIQNVTAIAREYYLTCKKIPQAGFVFLVPTSKSLVADAIGANYAGKNQADVDKLLKADKTELPQNMNAIVEAIYKVGLSK